MNAKIQKARILWSNILQWCSTQMMMTLTKMRQDITANNWHNKLQYRQNNSDAFGMLIDYYTSSTLLKGPH